jgi:hypothetical protein
MMGAEVHDSPLSNEETWNAGMKTGGIVVGDELTITLDVEFTKA